MLKPVELKNGMRILRLPKSGTDVFTVGFVVHTGTANEKDNFPLGITNLVEKLFWSGTDKHPSTKSLNYYLESIGGRFVSLTSYEITQFYISVPKKNQFKAISFLAEVMQNSFFDYKHIEKHKQRTIDELKTEEFYYQNESEELGFSNIYQNYGLGQPRKGTVESVFSITQEDVLDFISSQFNPKKCYLILSGDFDNRSVTDLSVQEWSVWNPTNTDFVSTPDFDPAEINLPKVLYKQRGINQTQINIGFILDEGMDVTSILQNEAENTEIDEIKMKKVQDQLLENWSRILLLNTILGKGYSCRLWTKGVDEESFFYTVKSDLYQFSKTATLELNGLADNTQFTFALECMLSVIESLKKTTVSINELTKAKEFLKGNLLLDQENHLDSVVWRIENFLASGLTFKVLDLVDKIDEIEAKEIRALADELFIPERMYVTTFGPAKETRLVEKLVRRYIGAFENGNF